MLITALPAERAVEAVALWHEVGLTRPWNDPSDDLTRALAGPSSTVLAGLEAGRLVGTVMVGIDGHRGWIYYLAVARDAQGRGLGRALLAAAEDWARARGMPKLLLMVRSDNEAAAGFYARLGYEPSPVTVLGRRLDG